MLISNVKTYNIQHTGKSKLYNQIQNILMLSCGVLTTLVKRLKNKSAEKLLWLQLLMNTEYKKQLWHQKYKRSKKDFLYEIKAKLLVA